MEKREGFFREGGGQELYNSLDMALVPDSLFFARGSVFRIFGERQGEEGKRKE